jgi:hypothetical protein
MIIPQHHGRRLPSVLLSAVRQHFFSRFLHREHRGTFQSGADDDPTASHDAKCILASHIITGARGCRRHCNRYSYHLPRPPPAAERDGVCIATLRRAKFDIGVRSSKDGKSGAWWWTLPHPED